MTNYWKNKKILITGAAGFVGSNASHFFTDLGCHVKAVVSPMTTNKKIERHLGEIKNKIVIQKANLLSVREAVEIARGQDMIFHFAALDGSLVFKKSHSADAFSHNMRMNLNIFDSCITNNIRTVLFMSSADIYTSRSMGLLTEKSSIEMNWETTVDGYKLAKWTSELAAKEFYRQYGINSVILRPSNLYGPRDEIDDEMRMRFIPSVIKKIEKKEPIVLWGSGNQTRSFLYILDFLVIAKKLLEKEAFNLPINVAGSRQIKLRELVELISKVSGKKATVTIDKSKSAGSTTREFDLTLLKKLAGVRKELSLERGLKETLSFYNNHYFY